VLRFAPPAKKDFQKEIFKSGVIKRKDLKDKDVTSALPKTVTADKGKAVIKPKPAPKADIKLVEYPSSDDD
jgi:hypothetical protein